MVCAGVEFITHDVAWRFLSNNPRYANKNKCNRLHLQAINVKDGVMIGAHAIILPGVTINCRCWKCCYKRCCGKYNSRWESCKSNRECGFICG